MQCTIGVSRCARSSRFIETPFIVFQFNSTGIFDQCMFLDLNSKKTQTHIQQTPVALRMTLDLKKYLILDAVIIILFSAQYTLCDVQRVFIYFVGRPTFSFRRVYLCK